MGTNFDVRFNICETCGNYEELHLGKASYGWEFSFQGHDGVIKIKSVKTWKEFIDKRNGKIFDEYNRENTWEDIMARADIAKDRKKHTTAKSIGFYQGDEDIERYYYDSEGYCFTNMDFS